MIRYQSRSLLLVFVLFALGSAACSLTGLADFFGAYPTQSGALLFQDGFDDPGSGWDRVQDSQGQTDYENGRYRILVNAENADFWSNPGLEFSDVVIEVDAEKAAGPDDNDFGVLCRYQDLENFYFLIISSDGYYGIGKVEGGKQSLLDPPQMYYSEDILTGNATNHLTARCEGTRLTLAVNNEVIAEARDDRFPQGDVGLIVGTFSEPGVDIFFDNFSVKVP